VRIPSIFWAELSKSPQAEFATKKPPGTLIHQRFFFPDFVWLETLKLVAQRDQIGQQTRVQPKCRA
jgi:hypothetical protein